MSTQPYKTAIIGLGNIAQIVLDCVKSRNSIGVKLQ
jgi:hypothetical protein